MDLGRPNKNTIRVVGDYIIGPRIGSGSFAQVWRSKHRILGSEFAIKEIDKKHLNDNLLKEISILSNISHPNIIRLFEAIQCEERIYLVLEYCDGGDLGAYINRHGRVSQDVARHFMKQLAAGLQVLRENRLIHRDLKPQNLLLCGDESAPLLKIGDFGFARYLTDQGLADTLCGSPLYMAPEIIQNKKYDAKADLWSVGAILYQLVIGRPPFDGNSQLQLFQNILKSTELRFPEGAHEALHPDCLNLCRSLLRQNPVERITFEEFFNHRFLTDSRVAMESEVSSQISRIESLVLTDTQEPNQLLQDKDRVPEENVEQHCSSINDERKELMKDPGMTSKTDVSGVVPNTSIDNVRQSLEGNIHTSSKNRVADSLESIEKGYVLVHSNFASMDVLTSSLGTSLRESGNTKACALAPNSSEQQMTVAPEFKEPPANFGTVCNIASGSGMGPVSTTDAPTILGETQELSVLHPSIRLQLLHQYLDALSDLAREKLNENSVMESFSIELVILGIWREALNICGSWLLSTGQNDEPESSSWNETGGVKEGENTSQSKEITDLTKPSLASTWAERGFIVACDRSEKLSNYLQDIDGAAEMPDAMEIIFQAALVAGRNGAADQLIGNRESAATMYSKSLLLLSFIVSQAPLLPLKPPFSLAPDDKQRLLKYIKNLESHLSHYSPTLHPSLKHLGFNTR